MLLSTLLQSGKRELKANEIFYIADIRKNLSDEYAHLVEEVLDSLWEESEAAFQRHPWDYFDLSKDEFYKISPEPNKFILTTNSKDLGEWDAKESGKAIEVLSSVHAKRALPYLNRFQLNYV